jgi:hypothetical protein
MLIWEIKTFIAFQIPIIARMVDFYQLQKHEKWL